MLNTSAYQGKLPPHDLCPWFSELGLPISPHLGHSQPSVEMTLPPTHEELKQLCGRLFNKTPIDIERFSSGETHFVYGLELNDRTKLVVRAAYPHNAHVLAGSLFWDSILRPLNVPLPALITHDLSCEKWRFPFTVVDRLPGTDLINCYPTLSDRSKMAIGDRVATIQHAVRGIPQIPGFGAVFSYSDPGYFISWRALIDDLLISALERLGSASVLVPAAIDRFYKKHADLADRWGRVRSCPFLDDLTAKNVIVEEARLSGIVDVDQMAFGDPLLAVGQTKALLIKHGYDTAYPDMLCRVLGFDDDEWPAYNFYCSLYCVTFLARATQDNRSNAELLPEQKERLHRSILSLGETT